MAIGVILSGIGLASSFFAGFEEAEARREAAETKAGLLESQSFEVLQRSNINNKLLFEEAERFQGGQTVRIAASGRAQDVSTLAMLEETYKLASDQVQRNTRQANWEANSLLTQATSVRKSGEAIGDAIEIGTVGNAFASAGKLYDASPSGALDGVGDFFANVGTSIGDFFSNEYFKESLKPFDAIGTPLENPLATTPTGIV